MIGLNSMTASPARAYLVAVLERLDQLLQREVSRWRRHMAPDQQPHLKGVFISEGEVDQILSPAPESAQAPGEKILDTLTSGLDASRRQAASGREFSLPHLAGTLGLDPIEEAIVLLCLAPEIDAKYERLYGYLHDDITRKRPSPDLCARLLELDLGDRIDSLKYWSPGSFLVRAGVVTVADEPQRPLLTRAVTLNPVVLSFLLSTDLRDRDFARCVGEARPLPLDEARWNGGDVRQLIALVKSLGRTETAQRPLVVCLRGPAGAGRKTLASTVCAHAGFPLVVADARGILAHPRGSQPVLTDCFLLALMRQSGLYIDRFELMAADETGGSVRHFERCAATFRLPVFLGTAAAWHPETLDRAARFHTVDVGLPSISERATLWPALARREDVPMADGIDWNAVAATFKLTPGKMIGALHAALAARELAGADTVAPAMLSAACYGQSNRALAGLARKLTPTRGWESLVLPDATVAHLKDICAHLRHRRVVYDDWGFGATTSLGKGLCVLLHGPSGTGKTLSVEIIARELMMEAYRIDLSTVVSKYIGETEKNLSRIFEEAESSNAILFFDEADALFGKRSEVKDAHDRYANIEINYLLQRMESYGGPVFLATNARKNIDDAFFRRMQFSVEFPMPDESLRFRLWKGHLPVQAPVAPDVDLNFLARRFTLAGGNIKNVTLNAAFLAADNSRMLHMAHYIRALRREFEKIGLMLTENDIRPYTFAMEECAGVGG